MQGENNEDDYEVFFEGELTDEEKELIKQLKMRTTAADPVVSPQYTPSKPSGSGVQEIGEQESPE